MFETVAKVLGGAGLPWLAGKLLGDDAERYAKRIATALGLRADAQPDEIADALQADPEAVIKLRQVQLDETRAYLGDVQNSREHETTLVRLLGHIDYTRLGLVVTILAFGGYVLHTVFDGSIEQSVRDISMIVIGHVWSKIGDVYAYYFGSSKSSADKDEKIGAALNGHAGGS